MIIIFCVGLISPYILGFVLLNVELDEVYCRFRDCASVINTKEYTIWFMYFFKKSLLWINNKNL